MKVSRIMTCKPFTVNLDTPFSDALSLMRKETISRLPVLDSHNHLVGIVSEKDLLYTSPSPATSLNIYEMTALLAKLTIEKVMKKNVITVLEETPIENAVRLMVDNDIGGLPVMRDKALVGIVTETDVLNMFIELFGTRKKGVQITMIIPDIVGELANVTTVIYKAGGKIISLGTFLGETVENVLVTIKVQNVSKEDLLVVLKPLIEKITDVRDV